MHSSYRVGLIGELNPQQRAHLAIPEALSAASGGAAESVWIASDSVGNGESLAEFAGLWCVPGMPYRSAEGVLRAIRQARITRTPFLGTSAGFQYTLIEYARNVLGLSAAEHQKSNPKAAMPLVSPLGCALLGVKSRVHLAGGSILRKAYGKPDTVEEYRCSFGLNGRYRRLLEGQHLMITATDDQDEVRAVELDGHPFFVATLFQPELASQPNPLVQAFTTACARRVGSITRAAS
jgi:CTP synthase (UTP-ammonia lyase)